jgi:hypothetical protein
VKPKAAPGPVPSARTARFCHRKAIQFFDERRSVNIRPFPSFSLRSVSQIGADTGSPRRMRRRSPPARQEPERRFLVGRLEELKDKYFVMLSIFSVCDDYRMNDPARQVVLLPPTTR